MADQPDARASPRGASEHDQSNTTFTRGTKRRRQSPRSSKPAAEQPESSNASTSRTRTTLKTSPHRGSSRDTMKRSTSPQEATITGSVKYTKTGRVSKATKGQRIHSCEECGKLYTRAEHLRRHQQNHKPGAFPCDVPGCTRSFYREDLLTRHKARHDDPHNPPSRRGSLVSHSSGLGSEKPLIIDAPIVATVFSSSAAPQSQTLSEILQQTAFPLTTSVESQSSRYSEPALSDPSIQNFKLSRLFGSFSDPSPVPPEKRDYLDISSLPLGGPVPISIQTDGRLITNFLTDGDRWGASPACSSEGGYGSPAHESYSHGQPYYQPQLRDPHASNASSFGRWPLAAASRSPISASSSACYLGPSANGHFDRTSSTPSGSELSYHHSVPQPFLNSSPSFFYGSHDALQAMTPEERDALEVEELQTPAANVDQTYAQTLESATAKAEARYLAVYWQCFHPVFPIIHRPSFNLGNISPLLKAVILALGAQYLEDSVHVNNARILHERCSKCLKKRTLNHSHTWRICDMQAIFLIEAFSIFKSRRPPLQFSQSFEDLYGLLASDFDAFSPITPQDDLSQVSSLSEDPVEVVVRNHETKCKQRLLVACYILDQQHAVLFGRQRSTCASSVLSEQLPFPRSTKSWDALPEQQAAIAYQSRSDNVTSYDYLCEAVDAASMLQEPSEHPQDMFQSMLMISYAAGNAAPGEVLDVTGTDLISLTNVLERSVQTTLTYKIFMLCKHTPVRELLAVAGETWVMAEKISNDQEYEKAQLVARQWAKGECVEDKSIRVACSHAIHILQCAPSKRGLLFEEWATYLASIVLWAKSYVLSTEKRSRPRISIPPPVEPRPSQHELDQAVRGLVQSFGVTQQTTQIRPEEAKNVLLWTRDRIQRVDVPHACGVTNSAIDVLGRLVLRGYEPGWF